MTSCCVRRRRFCVRRGKRGTGHFSEPAHPLVRPRPVPARHRRRLRRPSAGNLGGTGRHLAPRIRYRATHPYPKGIAMTDSHLRDDISLEHQLRCSDPRRAPGRRSSTGRSGPRRSNGSCTPRTTKSADASRSSGTCRRSRSGSPGERLTALARVEGKRRPPLPVVLFLCTHNAGRSQMALGFLRALTGDHAVAWSGGSEPGHEVNPAAIAAMAERASTSPTSSPNPGPTKPSAPPTSSSPWAAATPAPSSPANATTTGS